MPVSRLAKWKTAIQMVAIGVLIVGAAGWHVLPVVRIGEILLWAAALLTPRPPELMVLNEPETSLHPDLLPALARAKIQAQTAKCLSNKKQMMLGWRMYADDYTEHMLPNAAIGSADSR